MEWTPGGVSGDIEDRRDDDSGGGGFGFGGGGFGGIHLGVGGTILLLIVGFVFRHSFLGTDASTSPRPVRSSTSQDREVQFVSFVLDDVQHTWEQLLPDQANVRYRHAKLVLFRDYTDSGCGEAQSATGPFYCPVDEKVYIDLSFFDELRTRFGAPGEFAEAYVIAHEIGHHIQKLLGIETRVQSLRQRDPEESNPLSVSLELQADCFAGIWGHSTEQRNIIDQADIAAGLRAAVAVGDDRLQRMATGHISPESFTHGSSAQRTHWFKQGLDKGQISSCVVSRVVAPQR
jgi:hypothetical protein